MENSNRPVTGYPAPTGYPVNPRPSAYPYYQPHYPDNYDTIRHANCIRRIFALAICIFVIMGTITFIVWLVLRPQIPEFRVDSLTLSNFTLGNTSLISFTSQIGLTAVNPNKKMTLAYDHIDAMFFYDSDPLSHTTLSPFSQGIRNETSLTANFAATGSFVEKSTVDNINFHISKDGSLTFNLRMIATVRFLAKAWRTRGRFLKVVCGGLVVTMPDNGRSGTLTGGPRQCRVDT